MKLLSQHILFLIFLALFSCSSNSDTEEETVKNEFGKGNYSGKIFPTEKTHFYAQYQGTLNNKIPIHLNLVRVGEQIQGYFYHDEEQIPNSINDGKLNDSTGIFSFEGAMPSVGYGKATAQFQDNKIAGIWVREASSQQLSIELTQITNSHSLPMEVFYLEETNQLKEGDSESPAFSFIKSILMPSPKYEGAHRDEIHQIFKSFSWSDTSLMEREPGANIQKMKEIAVKEYREFGIESYEENPDFSMTTLNWEQESYTIPVYNEQNLLSIEQNWYNYMGGVHGDYGKKYQVINLKTGQKIKLANLFSDGSQEELTELIKRKILENRQATSLEEEGYYADKIKPTENFYLTKKGIGFYYNSYEIAPYVKGGNEVFLRFSECKGFMKTDF